MTAEHAQNAMTDALFVMNVEQTASSFATSKVKRCNFGCTAIKRLDRHSFGLHRPEDAAVAAWADMLCCAVLCAAGQHGQTCIPGGL